MVKKVNAIWMSILIILFSTSLSYSGQSVARAKLVLFEKEFDFGKVKEGSILKHDFRIKNSGNKTLRILKVKPG